MAGVETVRTMQLKLGGDVVAMESSLQASGGGGGGEGGGGGRGLHSSTSHLNLSCYCH